MKEKTKLSILDKSLSTQIDQSVLPLLVAMLDKTIHAENGYYFIYWRNHPNATRYGKVFLHRHIAAIERGSWLGENEIVAFLDGDKTNLRPENLLITTRKAYSSTDNHLPKGGKRQSLICEYCGKRFEETYSHAARRKTCSPECAAKLRRKFDPDPAELEKLVWEMPTTQVAEIFGVSDKAISKRCKLYGIEKPPRGYWVRVQAGYLPEQNAVVTGGRKPFRDRAHETE